MSLKVDEFIEELEPEELVYLWEQVNMKEFILMISDEIKKQTSDSIVKRPNVREKDRLTRKYGENHPRVK